jgi:hypothetical protein
VKAAATLWLTALLMAALPVQAEHRSISASTWSVSGRNVTLRLTLPTSEARYLARPGYPLPGSSALATYLLKHLSVRSDRSPCPAIDQGYDIGPIDTLSVGKDLYGFEVMFLCASSTGIVLEDSALFELAPAHMDFARIASNGGAFVPQLFTASQQTLHLPEHANAPPTGLSRYLYAGFLHILRNLDRLCFLMGALLIARRWQERLCILGGLSLGYAAAVAVSLAGLLVARMSAVEAWLGFMVALTAALMIVQEVRRPAFTAMAAAGPLLLLAAAAMLLRATPSALLLLGAAIFAACFLCMGVRLSTYPVLWLLPTAVVGLLDGSVLPGDLTTLQLSPLERSSGVIAFDIGAILADALLVAVLLLATALLRRRQVLFPVAMMRYAAATALAFLGSYWLVSRLAAIG